MGPVIHGASLPGVAAPGEDRWTRTATGVIVLDGATSVRPDVPHAGDYVDALLDVLTVAVDSPSDTRTAIADAIEVVAANLDLTPGASPSSTVAVLRERGDTVEAAVLGDSTIMLGFTDGTEERLTDNRLWRVAVEDRTTIHERLRNGSGYDDQHDALLRDVQAVELRARNIRNGYWIAEADSLAGHRSLLRRYPRGAVAWAVLATDGAQRGLDHHRVRWADLPGETDAQLRARLDELHRWEAADDPHGRALPRSKRHDDKTLVTWTPGPGPGSVSTFSTGSRARRLRRRAERAA